MSRPHGTGYSFRDRQELLSAAEAMEREAARRYRELAAAMAAAGNEEVQKLFERLDYEERRHETAISERARALGVTILNTRFVWQSGEVFAPDQLEDEDPYTLSAYRALSIAVHNEERAFAFYSYAAAYAPSDEVRLLAEDLAQEELRHASILRRERRRAYHRARGERQRPADPLPLNLEELETAMMQREGASAARLAACARQVETLGDHETGRLLDALAAECAAFAHGISYQQQNDGISGAPGGTPGQVLRDVLAEFEQTYDLLMRVAETAKSEALQVKALELAESVVHRITRVRERLAPFPRPGAD
jgi:rubrerythrin